ncbi:LacI family DNA-binding transcriptional regulator [Listeria grayi]|uniref:LacI family DNA-binding transcriptional regulator n=1 Tax=Listeria grayi TaxID=1641 RepID=UPI001559BF29|nr:LacI family DNA-binding transcriptional regulator [Listeria grayi]
MKIRLKDIAQMAHVSETTASLVLNDAPSRISEAKRQEIKKSQRNMAMFRILLPAVWQ